MHVYIANINKQVVTKSLKQSVLLLYAKRNQICTKLKTHYETLGIPINATFNEIKSAYFELTLKYHPDRNKDETAREKFHEISEAYDVLSRYNTRKQYDETLLIKYQNLHHKHHKMKYETGETGYTMKGTYNFDEWLRSHYTELFQKKQLVKRINKNNKPKETYMDETQFIHFYLLLFLLSGIYICVAKYKLYIASKKGK